MAVMSGSTPRSNLLDASVVSLWRREERATEVGSKCADSTSTSVVDAPTSDVAPPINPAMASRAVPPSEISRSSGVEGALNTIEGLQPLTGLCTAHHDRPLQGRD